MAVRHTIAQLVIGLRAELRQFQLDLQQGLSSIQSFGSSINSTTSAFYKFSGGLAAIAAAIVGVGTLTTKVFADLEQSIANTASVTGDTMKGVDVLEKHAREMGKSTIFTATQAAEAMYYLASAGYNAGEIFSSLDGILDLAAATQYDLAETTATVVSTLRAFNYESDQASRIANVFASAISSSQATMLKLQESMKYISPVAAQLNWNIEQTTAALSILYNSGLEASMSGTQLRMAITRLLKPTKASIEAFKRLGIEYENINPASKNLVEIITELEGANAGAAEKAKYMAEIFGVRAVNAMSILVRNGSEALMSMEERITGTSKAADMQQRQIDTLKGAWRLMTSALQEASIIIGKNLRPAILAVIDAVRQLALTFSSLPTVIQKIIVFGGLFTAVFAGIGAQIALVIAILPKLLVALSTLKMGIIALGGPITIIIAGLAALAAAIIYLLSAREREQRQMKNTMLEYNNYLNARQYELRRTVELIDKIRQLNSINDKNATNMLHLKNAVTGLNKINPKLINDEEDLSLQLGKLNVASKNAAIELEKIVEAKAKMKKMEINEQIRNLTKETDKLKKSLDGVSFGKKLSEGTWKDISKAALKVSKESKDAFVNDITDVNEEFGNMFGQLQQIGLVVNKGLYPNYVGIRQEALKMLETEDGVNKLIQIQDGLMTKSIDNRSNGLTDVAAVEDEIYDILADVLSVYNELKRKEEELANLTGDRKDVMKIINAEIEQQQAEMNIEAMKEAKDREDFEYDLAVAGVRNRIKLREMELEKWKTDMIHKATIAGIGTDEQLAKIDAAYLSKKIENDLKSSKEIAEFDSMIMLKANGDILANKIAELNEWKRNAMETADAVGKNYVDINKKYEIEIDRIRKDFLAQYAAAYNDIIIGNKEFEIAAMQESVTKTIALENLRYDKAKIQNDKERNDRMESVRKGLLDEESVKNSYKAKQIAIYQEHVNKLLEIDRTVNEEKIKLINEINIEKMKSSRVSGNLLDIELKNMDIEYQAKIAKTEELFRDRLEMVKQEKIDSSLIEKAYIDQQQADYDQYMAKRLATKLKYEADQFEIELGKVEIDNDLYRKRLEAFKLYLLSKKELVDTDFESYKSLLEMIQDVDEKINDSMVKRSKSTADTIVKVFEIAGKAVGESAVGIKDAWKTALKSTIGAMVEAVKKQIEIQIALYALAGDWMKVGQWAALMGVISAVEAAAYSKIDSAAYGGKVMKTGIANVHEGEVIMPSSLVNKMGDTALSTATLQRSTWNDYAKSAGMGNKTAVDFNFNVNADGAIIYPVGTDGHDQFYERVILPAEKRFKSVMKSVIGG